MQTVYPGRSVGDRMPPKPEPRVDVDLSVRVFGMGADNRPFFQNAHARNVSDHGAKLSGIEKPLKPGDVIGVRFGDKKARCKVVWVVDAGEVQKIEVGVRMVEGQQCPWQTEVQQVAGNPSPVAQSEHDKRKFQRHRIPFPIEITDGKTVGMSMRTNAADINGRGCYVETMLPFPAGKVLSINLWINSEKITTSAIVRSCDGGVGMGIEFTGLDPKIQERLQQQVETMAAECGLSRKIQGTL